MIPTTLLMGFIYFLIPTIFMLFFIKAFYSYMYLYRKKKNPGYPILPMEPPKYMNQEAIHKLFLTPIFMTQIIFERHKDKDLNAAAKKVRSSFVLYLVSLVLNFLAFAFIQIYL